MFFLANVNPGEEGGGGGGGGGWTLENLMASLSLSFSLS